MSNNSLGKLRRSVVITTFGPGSIVDFRADGGPVSAVVAGLEIWDERAKPPGISNPQTTTEPRLQKKLGVLGFRLPPVVIDEKDDTALVGVRFPEWLQCPSCHRLRPSNKWGKEAGRAYRVCPDCNSGSAAKKSFVVPVRFIAACEAGHLEDFPWDSWVGHKEGCVNRFNLTLKSEAAGLAGLVLRCPKCDAFRTMENIFRQSEFQYPCHGQRPWLRRPDASCGLGLRALQRGASNLYFPVIHSALSIPPWSDVLQQMLGTMWDPLVNTPAEQRIAQIQWLINSGPLAHLTLSASEIAKAIEVRAGQLASSSENLRVDEYAKFTAEPEGFNKGEDFELRAEAVGPELRPWLSRIRRAVRLREVRAISGFTRIDPPFSESDSGLKRIAPISEAKLNWLPAIDVRGEGIFLELDRRELEKWSARKPVSKRAEEINDKYRQIFEERYGQPPNRIISPTFILIHTFVHVLMRQLSLECGYSSASLRERLYVDDGSGMHGALIYTATADSDGTLGGLARQGSSDLLTSTIRSAIASVRWCSSDPLCIQGIAALSEATNGAACHACVLAPETSCEEFNGLLDRALLVGLPGQPEIGYFAGLTEG